MFVLSCRQNRHQTSLRSSCRPVAVALISISIALISQSVNAAEKTEGTPWYVGGALGLSKLKPETEGSAYSVSDSSDLGVKLLGGINFSKAFALEFSVNDMGEANLLENGQNDLAQSLGYRIASVDGIFKFPYLLPSISPDLFLSVGLTALKNTADIPTVEENQLQMKLGVGLDFPLFSNWTARTSMEKFSGDTAFVSVGLLRHFGKHAGEADLALEKSETADFTVATDTSIYTPAEPEAKPAVTTPQPTQAQVVSAVKSPSPAQKKDSDQDGVTDNNDRCHGTLLGLSVNEKGCGIFDQSFSNITFRVNSTVLTASAKDVLDNLANELKKVPNIAVEVQAHTDNSGSSNYNIWLSNKRAEAIVTYLLLHGIAENRLHPRGYGETMPIASNKTPYGKAKNRRAEFKILNKPQPHPHP